MILFEVPEKKNSNVHIVMLIFAFGVVAFFLISSIFFFRNKLFGRLFVKYATFAAAEELVPKVDLKVEYRGNVGDGVLNINSQDTPVKLTWATSGNPNFCRGRSWGLNEMDKSWDGEKDKLGGEFTTSNLVSNGPYVYTIECRNEGGDSSGDSITINIGASSLYQKPFITNLYLEEGNLQKGKAQELIDIGNSENINIAWSGINLTTPYSICVASGSWPINYKNVGPDLVKENLKVTDSKIYKFSLYCSNESSFATDSLTLYKR